MPQSTDRKFKIGDRVRVAATASHNNRDFVGAEFTIDTDEGANGGEQSWSSKECKSPYVFYESELEPQSTDTKLEAVGHTAGWSYELHELSEGFSAIVYDEHGTAIADHLSEDRARLIAAAPDLLSELKAALYAITEIDNSHKALRKIRAAIAKAEGRAS